MLHPASLCSCMCCLRIATWFRRSLFSLSNPFISLLKCSTWHSENHRVHFFNIFRCLEMGWFEAFLPKLSIFFTFFSLHFAAALRFLSLFSRAFSSSFWLEDLEEKTTKSVLKCPKNLRLKNITLKVVKYLLKYCLASGSYLGVMSSRLGTDRFWLLLCWLGAGEWIGLNGGGDRWTGCWMKICKTGLCWVIHGFNQ